MSTKQTEVITLQAKIIAWFQQQILLQRHPTTIETKTMMDLLGQALQYHKTLIELEERLNGSVVPPTEKQASEESKVSIQVPIVEPKLPIVNEIIQEAASVEEEPIDVTDIKNDREYFSLSYAHADAVSKGCQLKDRAFRDQLVKGETLFGWHKEAGMGSNPCYFKE